MNQKQSHKHNLILSLSFECNFISFRFKITNEDGEDGKERNAKANRTTEHDDLTPFVDVFIIWFISVLLSFSKRGNLELKWNERTHTMHWKTEVHTNRLSAKQMRLEGEERMLWKGNEGQTKRLMLFQPFPLSFYPLKFFVFLLHCLISIELRIHTCLVCMCCLFHNSDVRISFSLSSIRTRFHQQTTHLSVNTRAAPSILSRGV